MNPAPTFPSANLPRLSSRRAGLGLAQLLEELFRQGPPREVDRPVHAVEQRHERREMGGQVELHQLDDHAVGRCHVGVADRAGAPCVRMDVRPGVTQAGQHSVEVGRLNAEMRHTKARAKRPRAHLGRLRWRHPRRELADNQELSTEEHAVVLTALAGGDGSKPLGAET